MEWFNALMTSVKDFRDFVFRPLFLFTFAILALILRILPNSFLTWLGLDTLIEQHRAIVSIATIALFALGFIRILDVYFFPWRKQRKQQKRDRESLRGRLETLSRYELSILAYCLSRNRKTFFVLDQGRNPFEEAVRSLTTRGFFKQGPLATQGYSFDITDDYWPLLHDFKENIKKMSEAVNPDWEQGFESYDDYQKAYGFGKVAPSADFGLANVSSQVIPAQTQKEELAPIASKPNGSNYTLYTKDTFLGIIWKWHYKPEFGQKPLNLTPYCPDCEDEQELVPRRGTGPGIYASTENGRRIKVVACRIHRKAHEIPVDAQGNYATVITDILNTIKNEQWK